MDCNNVAVSRVLGSGDNSYLVIEHTIEQLKCLLLRTTMKICNCFSLTLMLTLLFSPLAVAADVVIENSGTITNTSNTNGNVGQIFTTTLSSTVNISSGNTYLFLFTSTFDPCCGRGKSLDLAFQASGGGYAGGDLYGDDNGGVSDTELDALNGGNGDYAGALFSVSGANLQSGGQTFATLTNTSGVLSSNANSSETTATKSLVQNVLQRIKYNNKIVIITLG